MTLSRDDIQNIADLARIGVTEEEIDTYQKELSSVLAYFEKLQELDTETIEEIGHITGVDNVYREDDVEEVSEADKSAIMDNVTDVQDGYIKVKSVL
jgi:aspartyl-tRNA(Asn)/glutamyl-tRNA(Gln) amidotransferase subunit C